MLSNIAVCPLASIILILVIIINILDIYLVGFQFAILITNLLISAFFVWLANKTCDKYQWVSWLITAYFVISIIGAMAILTDPARYSQSATAAATATTAATAATADAKNGENQGKRVRFTDSS
jgi:type IV secretory pathway TraG/TraD family ATPase VirD4